MKPPLYQPKIKERHVEAEIMQRLAYAGIRVRKIVERIPVRKKNGRMARTSDPGIPDLVGWAPIMAERAFAVFIEVKRPGGPRRPMQELFIGEAKLGGCIAFFAESWADVVKGFAAHGIDLSRKGGIDG